MLVTMRARGRLVFLIGLAIATSAACGSFNAENGPPAAPPDIDAATGGGGEAGCDADLSSDKASCGACGHGCAQNESCRSGACVIGCPESIVYVSSSGGSDDNSGCTRAAPKATIGSAIGYVKTLGLQSYEIHACRGTYHQGRVSPSTIR